MFYNTASAITIFPGNMCCWEKVCLFLCSHILCVVYMYPILYTETVKRKMLRVLLVFHIIWIHLCCKDSSLDVFHSNTKNKYCKWFQVSPEACNRLFDTMETPLCVSTTFVLWTYQFIESLICYAHSLILISPTQTALSFNPNGRTPLNDFGTSPSAHCIHHCVDNRSDFK